LILVLGILILITLLVVAFLGHALSQVKSVTSYRAQTDSLLLSDVPVNLVKAQIDDATSQSASIWASQPGAIRTFKNDGSDATYGTTYKLYSSSSLTSTNPVADIPNDIPSSSDTNDWNSSPFWTDLNAPVQKSDGSYAYPIIDAYNDPADLPGVKLTGANAPPPSFSITANTVGATTPLSKTTPSTLYPVPMPIRWLYILKQGQIIAPDANPTSSTTATFNNASPAPTAANPIVGRVAYWTDDDTCRVNINTSSANGTSSIGSATAINTFWDTPKFTSSDDYQLGSNQPYTLEYQRYSGHPATTTLTLALPEFADTSGNVSTTNLNNILALTPRYGTGGSNGGTTASSSQSALSFKTYPSPPAASANTTPYRLYSSVNELLFNPPGTASPRTTSGLTRQQLETAKFFLTAHSRAPELNLFGMPRVSIWPISALTNTASNTYRTPTDNLLAFCATTNTGTSTNGAGTYYFTRTPWVDYRSSSSSTALTGNFSPTSDVNLARNVQLLTYLDSLTSQNFPVPGYLGGGLSFDQKYGSGTTGKLGMRQVLTEIFDYIRMTNARDPGLDPTTTTGGVPYAAATSYEYGNDPGAGGYGQIVPTQYSTWGTYGFGRGNFTLVNVGIIFVGLGQGLTLPNTTDYTKPYTAVNMIMANQESTGQNAPYKVDYHPTNTGTFNNNPNNLSAPTPPAPAATPSGTMNTTFNGIPPPGDTAVIAKFFYTLFDPALGYSRETAYINTSTSGLTGFTISPTGSFTQNQTLFFTETGDRLAPGIGAGQIAYDQIWGAAPGNLGGLMDFRYPLAARPFNPVAGNQWNAAYSQIINMPTGGTFSFSGGTFSFQIAGAGLATFNSTALPVIHTYTIKFPAATLPVPGLSSVPVFGTNGTNGTTAIPDRIWNVKSTSYPPNAQIAGQYPVHLIDFANDTVITMIPTATYGDYRMLSNTTTPSTAFQAHPNYQNLSQTQRLAHDLMYPSGQVLQTTTTYAAPTLTGTNASHGSLVNNASYYMQDSTATITAENASVPPGCLPVYGSAPVVPVTVQNPYSGGGTSGAPPDFDNGFGELPDGPYINKPDEGAVYPSTTYRVYYDNSGVNTYQQVDTEANPKYSFSPQRQVPSPVMFGSLPTGAPVGTRAAKPWQTLLFQPGATGHFGLNAPKDEFLLDLFWMPQASPYAISEPFSTAGKVNLNYQILPFTYIDRSTAIQSVLMSEKVAQVGASQAGTYKKDTAGATANTAFPIARLPLNLSETNGTLSQFAQTFSNFSIFRSAAQICEIYLCPQGYTWAADSTLDTVTHIATNSTAQAAWYGSSFSLVGDNTRERPYADIYSRITTKSNAYTVYYRVQTLKNTSASPTTWIEGTGVITGEFRGSTSLERYIDPNLQIPDYGGLSANILYSTPSLDSFVSDSSGNPTSQLYYKWRVVENNRFAP
jgi:uncharacterized protein (TIGR02600 family)